MSIQKTFHDTMIFAKRKWLKYKNAHVSIVFWLVRPVLLLLAFTLMFGKAIAGSFATYQNIITPGMIVFTLLSSASTVASVLDSDLNNGIFDRFRTLPIARISPLAGALIADVPQYLLGGIAISVVGVALGWKPSGGITGVIIAVSFATFFTWAMSWLCAATTLSDSPLSKATQVLLIVLIFLSNAFVPFEIYPVAFRTIVELNPVSHVISAVAILAEGNSVMNVEVGISMAVAVALILICAPLTVHAFNKKMQ